MRPQQLQPWLLCAASICLLVGPHGVDAEFWDSNFANTLFSFVRYKGYFVSVFQHATKPDHFFYSPLALLDKDSGRSFYNYLRGLHEIDFNVVMSTDELQAEVVQHLANSKRVQSPQVQMIPMETVRFAYASAIRRGSMKLDLEATSVPNNHLPNTLPIKFYSFSDAEARRFHSAVQAHPAILDQLVLEYTITQRQTAEKQVEIRADYIASTAIFAQLSTMTAPGTVRYLTARDANAVAGQSYSSIRAKVVRSQEYIEGPDELRLTQLVEQLLTRQATRWTELGEAARESVFWDPVFARPDEVTHLLNRVYERQSGSSRLLTVKEDERSSLERQAAQSTACYLFSCISNSSESGRRLDTRERLTEEEMKQFLNERKLEVEYTGRLFVVKNMELFRVNTADFRSGQVIASSSVQVTKKQEIHALKLKTDAELPDKSAAVNRAVCSGDLPYSYKGCYEDSEFARDLDGFTQHSGDMRVRSCYELCSARGFAYFGLQAGDRCHCGRNYGRYRMRPDAECDAPCAGQANQRCGGRLRNSVFGVDRPASGASASSGKEVAAALPENVYNSTLFEYRGCYADPDAGRQQPWLTEQSDRMAVATCHDFCARLQQQHQQAGWFALRAGSECRCHRAAPRRLRRLDDAACRVACASEPGQACGGADNTVSLYATGVQRQSPQASSVGGGGSGVDWVQRLAASMGSGSGAGYSELGCPRSADAFVELSAFQTPGLTASDCAAFCRADEATAKYFRVGDAGDGGDSFGFGSFDFGGGFGDKSCACLYTSTPEARLGFSTGGGRCGGYKYFAIAGRD